jgi:hypothetical protein
LILFLFYSKCKKYFLATEVTETHGISPRKSEESFPDIFDEIIRFFPCISVFSVANTIKNICAHLRIKKESKRKNNHALGN